MCLYTMSDCAVIVCVLRVHRSGWLTPEHPDPRGEQLVAFADVMQRERQCCRGGGEWCFFFCCFCLPGCCPGYAPFGLPCTGQRCCESACAFPGGEFMVFYDYASLPQKDEEGKRTEAEGAAFGSALETMGTWYAHKLATTVALDEVPKGWPTATPYEQRGWTTFESAVSALVKESDMASWAKHVRASATGRQGFVGGSVRPPPVHPEAFAATLARKIFTNGKSDCELVAGIYADTLEGAFGGAETLLFPLAGWGDAEMKQLAAVLPMARRVRYLDTSFNDAVGGDGWRALAAAIEGGAAPRLKLICPCHSDGTPAWPTSDGGALQRACQARGIKLGPGLN